jgi:hypothetical protein
MKNKTTLNHSIFLFKLSGRKSTGDGGVSILTLFEIDKCNSTDWKDF